MQPTHYKICDADELKEMVAAIRKETDNKAIIGVIPGVFDIIHSGHVTLLEEAKAKCDYLIVLISSDEKVAKKKGTDRPYIKETQRARTIAAFEAADAVHISHSPHNVEALEIIKPDVVFMGGDHQTQKFTVDGTRVEYLSRENDVESTTAVARKIALAATNQAIRNNGGAPYKTK